MAIASIRRGQSDDSTRLVEELMKIRASNPKQRFGDRPPLPGFVPMVPPSVPGVAGPLPFFAGGGPQQASPIPPMGGSGVTIPPEFLNQPPTSDRVRLLQEILGDANFDRSTPRPTFDPLRVGGGFRRRR